MRVLELLRKQVSTPDMQSRECQSQIMTLEMEALCANTRQEEIR